MSSLSNVNKCICNKCKKMSNFYSMFVASCYGIATVFFVSGIVILDNVSFIAGWICINCGLILSFIAIAVVEYHELNSLSSGIIYLTPIYNLIRSMMVCD